MVNSFISIVNNEISFCEKVEQGTAMEGGSAVDNGTKYQKHLDTVIKDLSESLSKIDPRQVSKHKDEMKSRLSELKSKTKLLPEERGGLEVHGLMRVMDQFDTMIKTIESKSNAGWTAEVGESDNEEVLQRCENYIKELSKSEHEITEGLAGILSNYPEKLEKFTSEIKSAFSNFIQEIHYFMGEISKMGKNVHKGVEKSINTFSSIVAKVKHFKNEISNIKRNIGNEVENAEKFIDKHTKELGKMIGKMERYYEDQINKLDRMLS